MAELNCDNKYTYTYQNDANNKIGGNSFIVSPASILWPVLLVSGDSDVLLGIVAPSRSKRKPATEELFSPFPFNRRKLRVCGVIDY